MLHDLRGNNQIPEDIIRYAKNLCDSIREDILTSEENGGLRFISDLRSSSKFTQLSGVKEIAGFTVIKATSHYNQLMKNIVERAILIQNKKLLIVICNKEFNSRHKLFDTSSTSITQVQQTVDELEEIIKPEYFPTNIKVIEISSVTHQRELIVTGYDKRTFINQL